MRHSDAYQVLVPAAPPARSEDLLVRAVTGDEERLGRRARGGQRALTALLARCAYVPGADHPIGRDAARAMASGERVRLGLALAAVSNGGAVPGRARCPEPSCRAVIHVRVETDELPERPPAPVSGTVRCPIPVNRSLPVRGYATFRLPDGADQEAVEAFSTGSRASGVPGSPVLVRLLGRLLISVSEGPLPAETALWAEEDRDSAWNAIRGAMGGPDTELDLTCQTCGVRFVHRLAPLSFIRSDAKEAEARLAFEAQLLCQNHGWTEDEVLWLPRPKRLELIELLRHKAR